MDGPVIQSIVGGCCSDPGDVASCSSYIKGLCTTFFIQLSVYIGITVLQYIIHIIISVTEHGLTLLPPPTLSEEEQTESVRYCISFILFFDSI